MSDQKVDLTCKHCDQAFSAFLSEMAEKNRKITCPGCGKVNEYSPADIFGRSSQQSPS